MKIKTIDIIAKEWFDKINGNSYFSARITLNYTLKNQITLYLPFQYGYGDHYVYMAIKKLQELDLIPDHITSIRDLENVIIRYNKIDKSLKRDVLYYGIESK